MHTSQFLIGAASSGSGKTTFTLGLLRALKNRGLKVQPFKCGPDYLDTKHHAAAAGQTSYNLDTFMASATHVQEVYARHSRTADICITEGVMGLFDGYDNMAGSSAELAGLLHLPVILVVNARSTAYTVAAILYGFKHFRPDIQIAGAVFNFVGSESHYTYLQQACRDAGVEALGYLPKCKGIEIPSRHLGLNIDSEFCFDEFADRIAYINHDIDDAIRAGILSESDIPKDIADVLGASHSARINTLVEDMISNTQNTGVLSMHHEVSDAMGALRTFMFERVYTNPVAKGEEAKAKDIMRKLFDYYYSHPDKLPADFIPQLDFDGISRTICDYIAGMTDKYAIYTYSEIFIPTAWQVR